MSKRMSFLLTAVLFAALVSNAPSQTSEEGLIAAGSSRLTAINLPAGAMRVEDAKVPEEVRNTLAKLIAEGGDRIRKGDSEVFLWAGNYKKAAGAQMIKNLETALKNSGWGYEMGETSDEFVMFAIHRAEPTGRALVGFFGRSEDIFIFALAEMVRAGTQQTRTENPSEETPANRPGQTGGELSIFGKWGRSKGGGFIDHTGKTNYKSGENFYFEFFPDGRVEYTRELDVLSIVQCKIKGGDNASGKFTVSGSSLIINLGAGKSFETNSCNSKENFTKALEPATITVQFRIKKNDSVLRPDKPTIMCFNGDDVCYEKIGK